MKEISEYIEKSTWRVNENANTNFSLSGLKSHIASSILARDTLSKIPIKTKDAHKEGAIHIHDLAEGFAPYCYGADFQQLLLEGLKNPTGSNSTPAKHLDTAVDHMVNYLYMSQNEFSGAQAFSNVDTLLAPYVIDESDKSIKQSIQRLIYNISYPLRSAHQTPFINFSFDMIPPDHMKNEAVVIGGRVSERLVYGDFQDEMDRINTAFLELMINGDSDGKPFTFPIPSYSITKDLIKKDDSVTNLLYKLSAKFGNPNYSNYIKSGADPSDVRAMCCRLSLSISDLKSRGLWNMGNRTGSLGVVTINLNHASKDGEYNFCENIDKSYDMAVKFLEMKHDEIIKNFNIGLFPFTREYLGIKDPFKSFFHTIGIIGMNEACLNMFDETLEFNQDFVKKTLKHLNNRTKETTNDIGLLFNLEETPAEGATHRLAKLDKELGLPTQGEESPYLTNSTHCPVNTIFDWAATVRIQEKFKNYYTGGTIMHGFVGEEMSINGAKNYIHQMSTDTTIPYYNITPTYSICKNHGRLPGAISKCPTCNDDMYIYSRVVGYLQPVFKWNSGKKAEYKDRKNYNLE